MPQYQNKLNLINQELGRLGQDKITDDVLARIVRNNNPDFYKDWSNEAIVDAHLWQIPELRNKVRVRTPGERAFDTSGSSAAPNFAEQVLFQSQNMLRTAKAGAIGMLSPDTEVGENARKVAEFAYENKIRDNQKLQALVAWKEKEAGWSGFDTTMRSLAEALPSLAMSVGAGVAAYYAAPATGGASVRAWAKWGIPAMTLAPIGVMESTSTYVDIMKDLVDDEGLTPSEARKYAYLGTSMYTPVSLFFERMGGKAFAKVGGMGTPAFDVGLRKSLTKKMVKYGLDDKRFAEVGARGVTTLANSLITATTEGTTEFAQSVWQQTVQGGIKNNVGRNQEEVITAYNKAFQESWMNKQSLEEGYAGVSTGLLGLFGLKNKVSRNLIGSETSSSDISDMIAENERALGVNREEELSGFPKSELKKIASELNIPGRTNLGKQKGSAPLINAILGAEQELAQTQEETTVETPPETGETQPIEKGETDIESNYLDSLVDSDNMQDVLDDASSRTDTQSKNVIEADSKKGIGAKVLGLVLAGGKKKSGEVIRKIQTNKYSKELLKSIRVELNNTIANSTELTQKQKDSLKLPDNASDTSIINTLGVFAESGSVREVSSAEEIDPEQIKGEFEFGTPVVGVDPNAPENRNVDFEPPPIEETTTKKTTSAKTTTKEPRIVEQGGVEYYADEQGFPVSAVEDGIEEFNKLVGEEAPAKPTVTVGVKETKSRTEDGRPLEKGMSVTLSDEILEVNKKRNIKVSGGIKNALRKLKGNINYEITSVTSKGFYVKDPNKPKEPSIFIHDELRTLDNKKVPTLTTKAPKIDDIIETDKDSMAATEDSLDRNNTKVQLQEMLKAKGLPVSGTKPELIQRIIELDFDTKTGDLLPDKDLMAARESALSDKKVLVKDLKKILGDKRLPQGGTKEQLKQRIIESEFDTKTGASLEPAAKPKKKAEDKKAVPKKLGGVDVNKVEIRTDKKTGEPFAKVGGKRVPLTKGKGGELEQAKALQRRAKTIAKSPDMPNTKKAKKAFDKDKAAFQERVAARVQGLSKKPIKDKKPTKAQVEREESKKRTNNKNLNLDFQDEKSSKEVLITEDTKLADKILSRLKKHFPFVDTKTFQGVLTLYGKRRIGFAMERLAAWSSTDARMDTMPHEYAHIYVKLFRNDPLVKQGIKKFGSEENLVKYIGLYYTNRARNTSLGKRIKIWLNQFANRLRRFFGKDVNNLQEFIAEEFYQGRFLGTEAIVGDQFIDFMDEKETQEDTPSGEETSVDATNATSDHHTTQFYKDSLGIYLHKYEHYPQLIELAKNTDTFDSYMEEVYKWAKKIADNRSLLIDGKPEKVNNIIEKTTVNGQEVYKMQVDNPYLFNELAMDWLKGLSKLRRLNGDDPSTNSNEARVYEMWTIDGKTTNSRGDGVEYTESHSRITKKKYSENVVKNFFEDQLDKESRLSYLSVKEIMTTNIRKADSERFYKRANAKFNTGQLMQLEQDYSTQYENMIDSLLDDTEFGKAKNKRSFKELSEKWMKSIVGSKLGDNAAVISTFIPKKYLPLNITPESFEQFFKDELALGNINQDHYNEFIDGIKDFDKIKNSKNPLIQSTIAEFIAEKTKEGLTADALKREIQKYHSQAISQKSEMSSTIGRYVGWQELRTPDYLLYEKSVADSMTRLSIDLAEGLPPRGLGKSKLMIIPENARVEVLMGKEYVEAGIYGDYDGSTLTSGKWFKKIKKILGGTDRIVQLKTFIRQRTVNKDGSVDYLGMKHMQFTPHKNMRFYDPKTNEMIAEVTGAGLNTEFISADGTSFDMIASPNEAKMMFGKKYSTLNEEGEVSLKYNEIHDIEESSIKIHDIQRKSKLDASHPIALGEMLMASTGSSKEARALVKEIKEHYNDASNYYMQEVTSIFKDSSSFNKFIQKEKKDGRVPTELNKYLALVGENGEGIWHPAIIAHIMPIINNRLIKNGLYKSRSIKKSGSKVYLKASAHLDIKEGNVMLSSDNAVAFSQIEKKFKEVNNIKTSMKKYWESLGFRPQDKHKKIKILNEFLENNRVDVLIHRNPIQKVTGVISRRVQRIHDGFHGETMFMTKEDVKNVLDGDWDGDTAQFEFINEKYANAVNKWQSSDEYQKLNKVVSVDIFGSRTDKPRLDSDGEPIKTSIASKTDLYESISENAKLDGTTGFFTNAKIISGQLFAKDFKLYHKDLEANEEHIRVKDPNSKVIMDYYPLDKDNLKADKNKLYKQILDNGDSIVNSKGETVDLTHDGDVFLQTTTGHEISTLFQMAVDSGKYDMLGKILDESKISAFDFMLTKIFEIADKNGKSTNKPLYDKNNIGDDSASKMTAMLSLAYSNQNISKRRAGTSLESKAGLTASFNTNVAQSSQLNDRHYKEDKLRTNKDFSNEFKDSMKFYDQQKQDSKYNSSIHGEFYGKELSMKNIISPAEQLILSVSQVMKNIEFYEVAKSPQARKQAHVAASKELMERAPSFKYWGDLIIGKRVKDFIGGHGFLKKENIFDGEKTSFIDDWTKLKESIGDRENIQSDLNDEFIAFTDRWQEQWNKLSETSQVYATLKMITGFHDDVHVNKLPPLALMNDNVVKTFLPLYEKHLRSQKADASESYAQDVRKDLSNTTQSELNNILKTYKQNKTNDELVGVCNLK